MSHGLERLGVSAEDLAQWEGLGLVRRDDDGTFGPGQLERIRVLRLATRRGIRPEQIAASLRDDDDVLGRYLGLMSVERPLGCSLTEAAEQARLDPDLVRRLWIASGNGAHDELFPDDVTSLRTIGLAIDAGLPAEALVQVARVLGDSLGRVADAEVRLFHFYVHERLRRDGLDAEELSEATTGSAQALTGLLEPAIRYYHRKALERSMVEDLMLHLAEEVAPTSEATGQMSVAVLFVDLAGFTPLTDAMGDAAAAAAIDRFSDLVREEVTDTSGRVIKQIGDEFMLVFPAATEAVLFGLGLCRRAAGEHQFPGLRLGAHTGPALYREADYLGATVNVAARVTGVAARGQFVVTEALHGLVAGEVSAGWRALGPVTLKGIAEPVSLYEVTPPDAANRVRDPVCGMELDPDRADVHLAWQGRTVVLCSETCRDRFLADPGRYALDGA